MFSCIVSPVWPWDSQCSMHCESRVACEFAMLFMHCESHAVLGFAMSVYIASPMWLWDSQCVHTVRVPYEIWIRDVFMQGESPYGFRLDSATMHREPSCRIGSAMFPYIVGVFVIVVQ